MFVLFYISDAFANRDCKGYLVSADKNTLSSDLSASIKTTFFQSTLDKLINLHVELYNQQITLLNKIRLELVEISLPRAGGKVRPIFDWQDLRYIGSTDLGAQLVVLKHMRDRDANLPLDLRNKIADILNLEKMIYLLGRDVAMLSSFKFGTVVEWQRVKNLKDALAELHYIQQNIARIFFNQFPESDFQFGIRTRQIPANYKYEDYLADNFLNQNVVEESELAERYRIIKHVVRLATAAVSMDDLKEVLFEDAHVSLSDIN